MATIAPKPFTAPVVDHLAVRVVVDSFYERFMPKSAHAAVAVEHVHRLPGREQSTLAGEWGLSLHLASRGAGAAAEYLLDFSYSPELLVRNFDLLGIAPHKLNGLILSHGHRDHYGGLAGFVAYYRDEMRDDLTLYAGGADNFREKWLKEGTGEPVSWGALDRAALAAARVATTCCDEAQALDGPFPTW
jgi:7,8-dihydropterin-6-yl-methyl-4-(beta-D-ribofuranosyl)aminobenzene 5'-phosphate synthase